MSQLKNQGYERYDLMNQLHYDGIEEDFNALFNYFKNLPEDDYAKGLNRYRRYCRALVLPTSKTIEWLPSVNRNGNEYQAYFQGSFNPEHKDAYREFHAIESHIRENTLLKKIIMHNYNETFWEEKDQIMPIHVGVHFVKLRVEEPDAIAVSSPNAMHQDGEPFTFVHLINRENVKGGTNAIGIPELNGKAFEDVNESDLHSVFELTKPLESYGVYDEAVSHYVSPVSQLEDGPSERAAILIDYQTTVVAEMD